MAIFPGAISTDSDLYIAVNNLSTLLTDNPLTIGATTVNVVSTTGFPTVGFISIGAEIIKYTGKTATSFTGCTRGADGTSAATHALNDQVDHNVIAAHHNADKDEIIAIEQFISDLIGRTNTQIRTPDGSVSLPSHSFAGQTNTGMYQIGGSLRMSANGVLGLQLSNSAAIVQLLSTDGSAALPTFGFIGDPDTGMFHPGANRIGFATNGTEHWEVTSAGDLSVFGGTERLIVSDGTVALPGIQFANDPDTGIYRPANNNLAFGTAGALAILIDSVQNTILPATKGLYLDGGFNTYIVESTGDVVSVFANAVETLQIRTSGLRTLDGTAALPSYSFLSDTNTGIFWRSADSFGFSAGGTLRATLNTTGLSIDSGTLQILDGTVGTPAIQFGADPDNGIYRVGVNSWALAAGGAIAVSIDTTGLNFYAGGVEIVDVRAQGLSFIDGTAGSPSLYFLNDTNTGFFRQSTDNIGISTGGSRRADVSNTSFRFLVDVDPNGPASNDMGDATNYWNEINYKTLTDRGCLPWCDDGVELNDGTRVSDLEALCSIQKHPTELTVHGLPKLDYRTFPKKAYRPADVKIYDDEGNVLCREPIERDENDNPIEGQDGVEMTMIFGVMIGAFKQLKAENDALKARLDALENPA